MDELSVVQSGEAVTTETLQTDDMTVSTLEHQDRTPGQTGRETDSIDRETVRWTGRQRDRQTDRSGELDIASTSVF